MIEGSLVEYRGDSKVTVSAGDAVFEGQDATHWVRNESDSPNHVFVIDLIPVE